MSYPIIGWLNLPEELSTARVFANIRQSGVNVFMTCAGEHNAILRQLDLAAEHGIGALVCDPRFVPSEAPAWQDETRAALREYGRHPGAFGFFIRDEPAVRDFANVARMVALLQTEAPQKIAYVNAFGFGCRGADSFAIVRAGVDTSHRPVERLSGDPVIVSFLSSTARRCMMLVNRNPARIARAEIVLEAGWQAAEILKEPGAQSAPLGPALRVALAPGDGRLFRLNRVP